MKHIELYKRNKLIYTIRLEMSNYLFTELFNKGIIEFHGTDGIEVYYLNNFDKVVIKCIYEEMFKCKN